MASLTGLPRHDIPVIWCVTHQGINNDTALRLVPAIDENAEQDTSVTLRALSQSATALLHDE